MKIGLVDLDTSHPENWVPIERDLGHEVVGVWDAGDVHPPGYAKQFARTHDVPRVYESLDELAADVDCAILHGCDWDRRIERARPFVEAGRAVFVDKPIAGCPEDLEAIAAMAQRMVRLTGGSSLRYCEEVQQFREQPVGDRGTPHTVFCGCGVDEYNYGIHAYTLLHAIMGAGPISARHVHQGVQRRIEIHWPGHRTGILMIGAAEQWLPFHATIVTEKSVSAFNVDASRLYRSMLEVVLPYLEGRLEQPPVSPRELIEPELMALAAKLSWENGDRPVRLDELNSGTVSYDGAAFAVEYKASKYGG